MKHPQIALLALLTIIVSCNKNNDPVTPPQEEAVEIPVVLGGMDLTWSQEPMTRAGENAVYFFSVKQDGSPYAWYCMRSFDDVKISLLRNHTYDITGYVAYDMTGAYYWRSETGNLISRLLSYTSNGVEYSDAMFYMIDSPLRSYCYKMLACTETITTVPSELVLNMYNAFFGLKVNATNLEGKLDFVLGNDGGESYDVTVTLTKEQPSVTRIIHFLRPLDVVSAVKRDREYTREVDYTLKYTDSEGTVSVLSSGKVSISRMKYTTVNIDMSSLGDNNAPVGLSLEEENVTDGATYDLNI